MGRAKARSFIGNQSFPGLFNADLAGLKDACSSFLDKRKEAGVYSMADIGLSEFSFFFMQSESFLSYQRSLEEGRKTSNCQMLFGMAKFPTDNHIRIPRHPHPRHSPI